MWDHFVCRMTLVVLGGSVLLPLQVGCGNPESGDETPVVTPTGPPESPSPVATPTVTPPAAPTPTQPPSQVPDIRLSTLALDFGTIPIGSSVDKKLTLDNVGAGPLSYTLLVADSIGGHFSLADGTSSTGSIAGGSSAAVTLTYAPQSEGSAVGLLTIVSNDPDESRITVALSGAGKAPTPSDPDDDGFSEAEGDCNNDDPAVHPGAAEICDGKDNDCNSQIDEYGATPTYADTDGDGFGDPSSSILACSPASGYVNNDDDCDDTDSSIYLGAPEQCDQQDNDCDGETDEGVTSTFYRDFDGDGVGSSSNAIQACSDPDGYVSVKSDCNDSNATVYPGAVERCDGIDNDCDTSIDEGLVFSTYYTDGDGDGFGLTSSSTIACSSPAGSVPVGGDCNDGDAGVNPGIAEVCNEVDDNCDSQVDNGASDSDTWYRDLDGDSFGDPSSSVSACSKPSGYVANDDDCDDTQASINPEAEEIVSNGIDEDCTGADRIATDLNQDGWADLVVPSYYNGSTYRLNSYVYWGSESGPGAENRAELPTVGAVASCVADFNGDGWLDIFFVNHDDGSSYQIHSYLYFNSARGFDVNRRLELPTSGAQDCVARDFNGDGYPDLALAQQYDGTTYLTKSLVYWNSASSFSPTKRTELPTNGPYTLSTADLDGDGRLDLIFPGYTAGGSVYAVDSYVYWNSPFGFSADNRLELPGLGTLKAIRAVDLNADGILDLVLPNHYNGAYSINSFIYWGPDYAVSGRTELPTDGSSSVQSADFDQDGFVDLFFSSYYGSNDSVNSYVYFGSALGFSLDDRQSIPSNRVRDSSYADVNEDGFGDLVLAVNYDGDFSTTSTMIPGSPTGFDMSRAEVMETMGAYHSAVSDLDLDGSPDIVLAGLYDGDYSTDGRIYWNSPRGIGNSTRTLLSGQRTISISAQDLNGDLYPELVLSNYYSGTSFATDSHLFWGSAAGYSISRKTDLPTLGTFQHCIADFNQDGYKDILFANYYDDSTRMTDSFLYWGRATGYSPDDRAELPSVGALSCAVGDLDSDGDQDIVLGSHYNDSSYMTESYVYWNTLGAFSTANRTSLPTYGVYDINVSDLDGDGYAELLFSQEHDSSSYSAGSYLYWGSPTGYSTDRRQTLASHGPKFKILAEDIDGDGYIDLLVPGCKDEDYTVNNYVYWGSVSGYSDSDRTSLPADCTWETAIRDLDRDGYKDIVLGTYFSSGSTNAFVYWGSSSGFSADDAQLLPTDRSVGLLVEDFNDDGFDDLLFATYAGGGSPQKSYLYFGSATGFSTSRLTRLDAGQSYHATTGDFDLDGRPDAAISNANYGTSPSFAASSHLYWNSARSLQNTNYTGLPMQGAYSVTIAGD